MEEGNWDSVKVEKLLRSKTIVLIDHSFDKDVWKDMKFITREEDVDDPTKVIAGWSACKNCLRGMWI